LSNASVKITQFPAVDRYRPERVAIPGAHHPKPEAPHEYSLAPADLTLRDGGC
jgi:hypothetical protein